LSTPRIAFISIDLQPNDLKTNGFIFGTKVDMPTMHTLHTQGPQNITEMANISVSGVLRPNDCGFACLLLRMDAHFCR